MQQVFENLGFRCDSRRKMQLSRLNFVYEEGVMSAISKILLPVDFSPGGQVRRSTLPLWRSTSRPS